MPEATRFPPGTVGAARDFLATHTGLPLSAVVHYAAVVGGDEDLAAIVTCCDDVNETLAMLRMALAALGSDAPLTPESRSVIVSRGDLESVLAEAIPADVRERFREALGEASSE
jgi:hypothetical protein